MKSVLIGMPALGHSLLQRYMQQKYVAAVSRAGGRVKLLSPQTGNAAKEDALTRCDGFLFPGGADISPELYGANREESCGKADEARDAFELPLMQAALLSGKPLLCICRGEQLLNVACGGTLLQDVSSIQRCNHRDFAHRATQTHAIALKDGSLLRVICGADTILVNSIHHQAVCALGDGLIVAAKSEDGLIEAIEKRDHAWCIGVQWHPEHMAKRQKIQQKLFDSFIEACRKG